MESAYNINHKGPGVDPNCATKCGPMNVSCCSFSDQQVADCTLEGADTCDRGGEPHDGILEVGHHLNGKLNIVKQYPYTSGKTGKLSKCSPKANAVDTGVTDYMNITSGDEEAVKEALYAYGVISIGIDASSITFQFYSSGVYNDLKCVSYRLKWCKCITEC